MCSLVGAADVRSMQGFETTRIKKNTAFPSKAWCLLSHLGLVILLQKNGRVDKYLLKRNSYQPLSGAVSIWLARTSRSWKKNKTFDISSANHNSLSKVEVKYSDEAGAATAVKCGVM